MYDYTYLGMKEGFILYFEVIDNKIIVTFADKSTKEYPYNEHYYDMFIKLMTDQVKRFGKNIRYTKTQVSYNNFWVIYDFGFGLNNLLKGFSHDDGKAFYFTISTLFFLVGSAFLHRIIKFKKQCKDYDKHKYYLDNKPLIDGYIDRLNNRVCEDTNMVIEREILPYLDINMIDKITFDELKSLVDKIMGFEECESDLKILLNRKRYN